MSLCNVFLDGHRAFVAVDTAALMQNGPGHVSKIAFTPHSGLVLACRGDIRLLRQAEYRFGGAGWDFDAALTDAPEAFRDITKSMQALDYEHWGVGTVHELFLIGWSEDRGRMAGCYFAINGETGSFEDREIGDCEPFPVPAEPFIANRPDQSMIDLEEMISIARKQVLWGRQNYPQMPIGGHLLVATLTRHEINVRDVCDLDA